MLVSVFEVAVVALIALLLAPPPRRGPAVRTGLLPAAPGRDGESRSETHRPPTWPIRVRAAGRPRRATSGARRWAGWIGGTLGAIAILNFLAFSVHTRSLGGSAANRGRAEGRYYVRRRAVHRGDRRTVAGGAAHGIAVDITHPLGLIVGGLLLAYPQRGGAGQRRSNRAPHPTRPAHRRVGGRSHEGGPGR